MYPKSVELQRFWSWLHLLLHLQLLCYLKIDSLHPKWQWGSVEIINEQSVGFRNDFTIKIDLKI